MAAMHGRPLELHAGTRVAAWDPLQCLHNIADFFDTSSPSHVRPPLTLTLSIALYI